MDKGKGIWRAIWNNNVIFLEDFLFDARKKLVKYLETLLPSEIAQETGEYVVSVVRKH